jgi:hypothetical protein
VRERLSAARLDSAFGAGGRVLIPPLGPGDPSLFPGPQVANDPDGRTLVASGREVLRLRPDGSIDPGFAESGRLRIATPPGVEFNLAELLVDSAGRIVLAGTALQPPSSAISYSPVGDRSQYALVVRYLPDGRLDPTFGAGTGMIQSDFGLPAPAPGFGATHTHGWSRSPGRRSTPRTGSCSAAGT